MNANQVVIVMDRGTADYLRLVGNDKNSPEFFSDCYQGEVMPAVEAALDRDPDAETLIAAALEPIPFRCEDPGCCDKQRERARSQARSVLHALQEGTENE